MRKYSFGRRGEGTLGREEGAFQQQGRGVGRGRSRGSCVSGAPVLAPSLTSNLNESREAAFPGHVYVGSVVMRDGGPASDAPALLILPHRRERRRLLFLAPRAAGSGCCLADLGVRTPRWNRSRRERSSQVLRLHPRPGRNWGIFHRGENGCGAEYGLKIRHFSKL